MPEQKLYWTKKQLREQLAVVRSKKEPTKLLKNATYLNMAQKKWMSGHIWIYENRIVYIGDELPESTETTEVTDCSDVFLVPGYIEPHVHPFQLYNPHTFAQYASVRGTTTFISDNMVLLLNMTKKKAFTLMEELERMPTSMFWWARYDAQTELNDESKIFANDTMQEWLQHPLVVQGGELTSWPQVLGGDDEILDWMQTTKRFGKPIEGHLPGSSQKTLTQMALLGIDADHEALTGKDAVMRMNLGLMTALRYSSIRPDLPEILEEMLEKGVDNFERVHMTTDGSTPAFHEQGVMDRMIEIALEKGVPDVEAYAMASYHAARHYNLVHRIGMIAPGRLAHINMLQAKDKPEPISVLAKGEWVRDNGENCFSQREFPWKSYGLTDNKIDWDLSDDDFQFSLPIGIEMVNSVITKPYSLRFETSGDELSYDHDESFLMLVDRHGKWRVNTVLKGFANKVSGFVSTYSSTGDILLIGKNKNDMLKAFRRAKELGGAIVLAEEGEVISEIKLPLFGGMSLKPMEELIEEEKQLTKLLRDRGYRYEDPVYSLLFFTSTHLPYVRLTQEGIYDVKNRTALFPAIMR